MVDVAQYLLYAQVAQFQDGQRNAKQAIFGNGVVVNKYVRLLNIVRGMVQWKYDQNPTDSTLDLTANFMYSLSGGRNTSVISPATTFFIVTNPMSQTVNSGTDVSFVVVVAGGTTPYGYQWRFNGTAITGETNSTLDLTDVDSGDAGQYSCVITDADGRILTSTNATLTINIVPIFANGYYSNTVDPYPDLLAGIDNLDYQQLVSYNHLAPIVFPWDEVSADNYYRVVRYPVTEGVKTMWVNTVLNQGSIPSVSYHEVLTIGSFHYLVSKGDSIFTPFIVTYT